MTQNSGPTIFALFQYSVCIQRMAYVLFSKRTGFLWVFHVCKVTQFSWFRIVKQRQAAMVLVWFMHIRLFYLRIQFTMSECERFCQRWKKSVNVGGITKIAQQLKCVSFAHSSIPWCIQLMERMWFIASIAIKESPFDMMETVRFVAYTFFRLVETKICREKHTYVYIFLASPHIYNQR